jgi:CRISPR-associated protein Cas1
MAVLYVTTHQAVVRKSGEALEVHRPPETAEGQPVVERIPLLQVEQAVLVGAVSITPQALRALLDQGAPVYYVSASGRLWGQVLPPEGRQLYARLAQFRAFFDEEQRGRLAAAFVRGKIYNARALLRRAVRKRPLPEVRAALAVLDDLLATSTAWDGHDRLALLGWEGQAAQAYFAAFRVLLRDPMGFEGRQKRPPTDPINALLSFAYGLLRTRIMTAIWLAGLDPYLGFLHSPEYGRPALALDLMEEFRPLIADSVVMTLVNTGQVTREDFEEVMGGFRLRPPAVRALLRRMEERLAVVVRHPVFGYRTSYQRCLELQVRVLVKALTGEIPAYRPFAVEGV